MDPNEELEAIRKLLLKIPNTHNSPIPPPSPSPYPYHPYPQTFPNHPQYPFFPNAQSNPTIRNHQYSTMPPPYQYQMFQPPQTSPSINISPLQSNENDEETPMGSVNESEDPPFCTQDGLECIDLGDEGGSASNPKKSRERFDVEEDKLLIQSYFNISEDPKKGNDQKRMAFWKRVEDQYNKYRGKDMKVRRASQLKGRQNRVFGYVAKFVGCYSQAVASKTSGSNDDDIMEKAMAIYQQDQKEKFTLEHAWRILKDKPRLFTENEGSSKRTKNSASGAYTSSSNPPTPSSEDNPTSPFLERPMGQKAAKRKGKSTKGETSSDEIRANVFNDFRRDYMSVQNKKAEARWKKIELEEKRMKMEEKRMKMEEEKTKMEEIASLAKDTSAMTERELEVHEIMCNIIRTKYGI